MSLCIRRSREMLSAPGDENGVAPETGSGVTDLSPILLPLFGEVRERAFI